MKTRHITILIQLAIVSILVGCHKQSSVDYPDAVRFPSLSFFNRTNNIDTVRLMMPGTYQWIETNTGDRNSNQYSSPFTELKTREYIFRADSSVELYENGRFKSSNRYIVDYEMPPGFLQMTGTIVRIFDKTKDSTIEYFYPNLSNDSALFSYQPYATSLFRRK